MDSPPPPEHSIGGWFSKIWQLPLQRSGRRDLEMAAAGFFMATGNRNVGWIGEVRCPLGRWEKDPFHPLIQLSCGIKSRTLQCPSSSIREVLNSPPI